jgi:hypothetical protein
LSTLSGQKKATIWAMQNETQMEVHGSGRSGLLRLHTTLWTECIGQLHQRRVSRVWDVPIHELGDPRMANASLVCDLKPLPAAKFELAPDGGVKVFGHGAIVAIFC